MTTAFLFPGQGSQTPGMANTFYDEWSEMQTVFDRLNNAAENDLAELCFSTDAEQLRRTKHTQPAVYAVSVAVAAALRERYGIEPDYVAGHSLGHFAAGGHSGLFDLTDGLSLVSTRGQAMERAGQTDGPGTMLAVLLADPETVADCCTEVDGASVAAYNTPRQTVISGTEDAVTAVRERIEERGRARFSELEVGAAFHSPVMERAVEEFVPVLEETTMTAADIPVVSDVTTQTYTDPAVARDDLSQQITSPVDWHGVVRTLQEHDVDTFVEVPPAGTLSRFVSRIYDDATVIQLEDPADAETIEEVFGS